MSFTRYKFLLLLLASLWIIPGCKVGPNYQRPSMKLDNSYRFSPSADSASIANIKWVALFQDTVLQGLVKRGLDSNYDIRIAYARINEARASFKMARGDQFPSIGAGAEASYNKQPLAGTESREYGYYYAAASLSWEIDIWGRVRNATDAAKAELLGSEEFRRGVVLDLVAGVAQTYAELMELDVELEVARRNTVTRQGTLDLFTKRSLGGVGNDLEVSQARADLAVTAAAIPATERFIALKESQLSVLLGRPPGAIPRAKAPVRQTTPRLPMGVPAALLADLADAGYLEQPHTSAGRVPSTQAYRYYVQQLSGEAHLSRENESIIQDTLTGVNDVQEFMERTSHVLSLISHNVGVAVASTGQSNALEHVYFSRLGDQKVLAVVVTRSGVVRDRVLRLDLPQADLDLAARYINDNFRGWTLDALRTEIARRIEKERSEYDQLMKSIEQLYQKGALATSDAPEAVFVEGAANLLTGDDDRQRLQDLLRTLEEKETGQDLRGVPAAGHRGDRRERLAVGGVVGAVIKARRSR